MTTISPSFLLTLPAALTGPTAIVLPDAFLAANKEALTPVGPVAQPPVVLTRTDFSGPVLPRILDRTRLLSRPVVLDVNGGANTQKTGLEKSALQLAGNGDDEVGGKILWIVPTTITQDIPEADQLILDAIAHDSAMATIFSEDMSILDGDAEAVEDWTGNEEMDPIDDILDQTGGLTDRIDAHGPVALSSLQPETLATLKLHIRSAFPYIDSALRAIAPQDRFRLIRNSDIFQDSFAPFLSTLTQFNSMAELCRFFGIEDINELKTLAKTVSRNTLSTEGFAYRGAASEKIQSAIYKRLYPTKGHFDDATQAELARVYACALLVEEEHFVKQQSESLSPQDYVNYNQEFSSRSKTHLDFEQLTDDEVQQHTQWFMRNYNNIKQYLAARIQNQPYTGPLTSADVAFIDSCVMQAKKDKLKIEFIRSNTEKIYRELELIFMDDEAEEALRASMQQARGELPPLVRDEEEIEGNTPMLFDLASGAAVADFSEADRIILTLLAAKTQQERTAAETEERGLAGFLDTATSADEELYDAAAEADEFGLIHLADLGTSTIANMATTISYYPFHSIADIFDRFYPEDRMRLITQISDQQKQEDLLRDIMLGRKNMLEALAFFGIQLTQAEVTLAQNLGTQYNTQKPDPELRNQILATLFSTTPAAATLEQKNKALALYCLILEISFVSGNNTSVETIDYEELQQRYRAQLPLLTLLAKQQSAQEIAQLNEAKAKIKYAEAVIAGTANECDVDEAIKRKVDAEAIAHDQEQNRRLYIVAQADELLGLFTQMFG